LQSQINTTSLTHGCRNGTIIGIEGGEYDDLIIKEFIKYEGGDSAKIVANQKRQEQEINISD